MKTAIYIEDGIVQLVLTAEDAFERSIIGGYEGKPLETTVRVGSFYECAGEYVRQNSERSLIIKTTQRVNNDTSA
jgi:hypothetical protein